MVEAFAGNRDETTTMMPTIEAFRAAHQIGEVTVVADAGMISAGNRAAPEAAGLRFIGKRHKRSRRFGWHVVAYASPDHLVLAGLSWNVFAPRPFRDWRGKPNAGRERRR